MPLKCPFKSSDPNRNRNDQSDVADNTEPRPKFNKKESIKEVATYLDGLDKNKEKKRHFKKANPNGNHTKKDIITEKVDQSKNAVGPLQQDSIGTSASASNIQQSDVMASGASTGLDLEATTADQQQKSTKVSGNRLKSICHICSKSVYKNRLPRHLKGHPEETYTKKPCNYCAKQISTKKGAMKNHVKKMHNSSRTEPKPGNGNNNKQ